MKAAAALAIVLLASPFLWTKGASAQTAQLTVSNPSAFAPAQVTFSVARPGHRDHPVRSS